MGIVCNILIICAAIAIDFVKVWVILSIIEHIRKAREARKQDSN